MKKNIKIITLLLIIFQFTYAQKTGVEQSLFNVQTGFLGVWVNNEYRLSNQIVLRSEVGLDLGFQGCSDCNTVYGLIPIISLEPRWYYNINKRNSKNRGANNSANFLALDINYYPDLFVISNDDNAYVQNQIAIIPKWGIRRSIGKSNFNYEAGIGIGVLYYLDNKVSETTADLHLRIGYTFK
ncbi:hypothetical protein SGQ44_05540 [Flavobacterium sp. Fl-77]|uniref:DUF3575 domain-containing protein n=1 Tax=Flavobacterium flavipigmentatum TaxID=2893884 RepID=A0AAJ2S651_9FLAO|nr:MULTISPECIES: hypothetical protein [unclassified Flavobacterium]MDX6181758.1 hypothetical protein [Flavobacterium sp. Fl-33]MDX6185208.1 hypothetical protein [Flavobacterium sp. Fl-77]UFH37315.1 hypothetical protein LNP22_11270 [Flavobacterium sp. F-70]